MLDQGRAVLTFSLDMSRHQTEPMPCPYDALHILNLRTGDIRTKLFCNPLYIIIIFITVEGTCGIYQHASRLKAWPHICNYPLLACLTQ